MKGNNDHLFLQEWKDEQIRLVKQVHPEYDDDRIEKVLDRMIDKRLKNPDCAINNNYVNKQARSTVLDIYDFIHYNKLIIAGGGVLFKNQHQVTNPPSMFLDRALKDRKAIKKQLKNYTPGSYEYMMVDLRQVTKKVIANSYYGASGNPSSPFFNINTALATTSTGQALISTLMCGFESFVSNNIKFYNIGDFVLYVYNSIHRKDENVEEYTIPGMPDITIQDLSRKVYGLFKDTLLLRDEHNKRIIASVLDALTENERRKLYYSSNLFDFVQIPYVEDFILNKIVYKSDEFKDANNPPKGIQDALDELWNMLNYWVVYNHPVYNRINRLKFQKRKTVLGIDTDSNFVCIAKLVYHLLAIADVNKSKVGDINQILYIVINTIAYELTQFTKVILGKYAKLANIPDDYAHWLNAKNEFYYPRIVFTNNKKNYMGIVRLREGVELIPEKLDIKGLTFMKSTSAPETKEFFRKLVKDDILYAENISGSNVLKKLKQFQRFIDTSLHSGEKTFMTPLSVKEIEAYKKPWSNQGIRGTYVWNLVHPDMEIQLPDKVRAVPVKMEKISQIEDLQTKYPKVYDALIDGVYNNPQCPFRDKGISVICIPSQVDTVPEWIREYIDTDKIIENNVTKIHPILESLGIDIENTKSGSPHFTNIITF